MCASSDGNPLGGGAAHRSAANFKFVIYHYAVIVPDFLVLLNQSRYLSTIPSSTDFIIMAALLSLA